MLNKLYSNQDTVKVLYQYIPHEIAKPIYFFFTEKCYNSNLCVYVLQDIS